MSLNRLFFIKWFGGKGMLVKKLLRYMPPHKYYAEVFGGGSALLFAKEPSVFEVYNDIDKDLFNLYQIIKDPETFKNFHRKISLTLYSRNEFEYAKHALQNSDLDPVDRAVYFYILARQSFSGHLHSWSYGVTAVCSKASKCVSAWLGCIENLDAIHMRLLRVQIENKHWKDFLDTYQWNEDGMFYIDPPYLPDTRRGGEYRYEMSIEEHQELIDYLLNKVKCKVMLSGYDNEIYNKLEANGWTKICFECSCHAAGKTRYTSILGKGSTFANQRRQECIWINYSTQQEKNLFNKCV